MFELPAPGPTGVRIAGDRYQWLVAWQGCVTALLNVAQDEPNPVVAIGVEVTGAGNVDDVVLYRKEPPHTYMQVKYATDSSTPVNEEYLLKPSDRGGPSILRKLALAWQQLTKDGTPVDLALLTNRSPDAEDPLVQLRKSETQLLLPKAAQQGPNSKRGQARKRWAEGAGLSEEQLMQLLQVLRFDLARDVTHLQMHLQTLMLAAGLRSNEKAMNVGADWVARQVIAGHRQISLADVQKAIKDLRLEAGPPHAVLSISDLTAANVVTPCTTVEAVAPADWKQEGWSQEDDDFFVPRVNALAETVRGLTLPSRQLLAWCVAQKRVVSLAEVAERMSQPEERIRLLVHQLSEFYLADIYEDEWPYPIRLLTRWRSDGAGPELFTDWSSFWEDLRDHMAQRTDASLEDVIVGLDFSLLDGPSGTESRTH